MAHGCDTLKLIGFAADDFRQLESEDDSFRTWLNQASSPAELIDAFQPALRTRPVAHPAEREVLRQLVPASRIVEASQLRTLPDDGAIWLWNSQLDQGEPVAIGAPVDPTVSQIFRWVIHFVSFGWNRSCGRP